MWSSAASIIFYSKHSNIAYNDIVLSMLSLSCLYMHFMYICSTIIWGPLFHVTICCVQNMIGVTIKPHLTSLELNSVAGSQHKRWELWHKNPAEFKRTALKIVENVNRQCRLGQNRRDQSIGGEGYELITIRYKQLDLNHFTCMKLQVKLL